MMPRKKIVLTVVDQLGKCPCHHGHKMGDSFDYDLERGKLCPMAAHVAFPYVEILKYGGKLPLSASGDMRFCCSDADVVNVFKISVDGGEHNDSKDYSN